MTQSITYSANDRNRIFLYSYYLLPSTLYKVSRVIGGPLLVALGIYFLSYKGYSVVFYYAYAGFAIGYGIYYMLKPFLILLFRKYKTQIVHVSVQENIITLADEKLKSELDLSKVKVTTSKAYYLIWYSNNSPIFLKKNLLQDEIREKIEEHVKKYK